jgi:predicted acyl esterase
MVRHAARLLALTFVLALAVAAGAQAKSKPTLAQLAASKLGLSCTKVTTPDKVAYEKCTGQVASFDGLGLDADVSIPLNVSRARQTIVMLHGWSQDKTYWEAATKAGDGADTWHWNNVWFVSKGWVVVNYTARGFQQSCGMTDQDASCAPNGYTHLADRRFETRDSQLILGKLVDAGIAKAHELASTGDSYGGGQTWNLATSLPWKSPKGVKLQLTAGVAKYPWTDLNDSLAPNGRATPAAKQPASHDSPYGIPKESYVAGLWAVGRAKANGRYDSNPADFGTNLDEQLARVQQGEPYTSGDPVLSAVVAGNKFRSAFYANDYFKRLAAGSIRPVPVMSIQGWTDPLFPAVQTLQMFRKLKAADPRYPIKMVFGDIGHSNAQNVPWQWHPINTTAYRFLEAKVLGKKRLAPRAQAYSFQTECSGTAHPAPTSGTWSSLATGSVTLTSTTAATTTSATPNPGDGAASDPIANNGCLHEDPNTTDPGGAYYTFDNPKATHLLGLPTAKLAYALTGTDATVALKLWDEAPDGSKVLVTRGEYRLSTADGDKPSGTLETYLYGNDWVFPAGDKIVLQVTQNDAPYLRPDNLPSSIAWSKVTLSLPTR